MSTPTTGSFISKDDTGIDLGNAYYEVDISLIQDYINNSSTATRIRMYPGTFDGSPSMIMVLTDNTGNVSYYDDEYLLEHIGKVTVS